MKCYAQVYVMNSLEAVETYCRAFGAEVGFFVKNEAQTAYEHCELAVNGKSFIAVAEAHAPYDVAAIHRMRLETMTFNTWELGSEEAVRNALAVLREGGVVLEELHSLPWNAYNATVIDRYGVCWWLGI